MTCPVVVRVSVPSGPAVARVATPGPPGPPGSAALTLSNLVDVDVGGKVGNSLLYYSTAQSKFIADSTITKFTITDGGNF
jgi:hypothetical protein